MKSTKSHRLLITGICGFVGSVVARRLLEHLSGLQIVGIDNLARAGSETNVEPLRALGIDVRILDLRNESDLAGLPPSDWVIDCAANPSVLAGVDGRTSAKELLDHNLGGTIHLLEYCRRHQAGFLLLSTSRVYSIKPLTELPLKVDDDAFVLDTGLAQAAVTLEGVSESFSTDPPISLYGASKRCSELLALEYGMSFGFPIRINRCGVLAGAGQFGKGDQGIFSYWIHSWAAKRSLKYIGFDGKGYQVRDCLHPRDLVPLLVRQITEPEHPAPPIVNLAGGAKSAMSLAQLSRWCEDRFGSLPSCLDPRHSSHDQTSRPFDIPWMILDSALARNAWDWQGKTSPLEILEEIASHAEQTPGWLDLVA